MRVRKHLREGILYDVQDRIRSATLKFGFGGHPVEAWTRHQVWQVRTRLDLWGGWRDVAWERVNE